MTSDAHLQYILRLADNALILGQRNAEWTGHGPVLEEDIALSNLSLDLTGQARLLYTHAGQIEGALTGTPHTEDDYAYWRAEPAFRNYTLLELPHAGHAAAAAALAKEAATKASGNDEGDGEESDESEDDQQEYMFAVPLVDYAAPSEETADVKKVYALVDRLSYLDWGLRTEDEVGHGKKRSAALMSSAQLSWGGCVVHDGAMWGEAAHGAGNTGPKTARTSEGYGEATCSTAEKLLRLLARLTDFVPAMGGW